jgi:hypothetical protein
VRERGRSNKIEGKRREGELIKESKRKEEIYMK